MNKHISILNRDNASEPPTSVGADVHVSRRRIANAGLAIVLAVLVLIAASAVTSAESPTNRVRIGTFDRAALLVAYYKSAAHEQTLADLSKARGEAEKAGNTEKVKEIEAKGGALQELAHQQLAGQAELTNIYEHLKAALPEVGKKANVALIVEKPWFHDESVELVDITKELISQLPPAKKGKG